MKHEAFCLLVSALVVVSCDENRLRPDEAGESHLPLENTPRVEPDDPPAGGGCSEQPSSLLLLQWDRSILNSDRFHPNIDLIVTNTAGRPVLVTPELRCSGLLDRLASVPLDLFELDAEESTSITVSAANTPLQVQQGASQLMVRLMTVIDGASGTTRQLSQSTPLYYRHSQDYGSFSIFDQRHLVEKKGGHLAGRRAGSSGDRRILGRIKRAQGGIETISRDDAPGAGVRLVGTSITVGRRDGNGHFVEGDRQ